MLRFLRIQHLAVIDSVEVEFDPGLNVLTGETGAGKSMLVEAVGLLLGGRASGDLVRTGEDVAAIEAIFENSGEELLVRREITAQGRSRAFINGALPPSRSPTASTRMDLPAPVSPVSTFNPRLNSTSTASITARRLILRKRSIRKDEKFNHNMGLTAVFTP